MGAASLQTQRASWSFVISSLMVLWSCQGCEKAGTGPPEAHGTANTEVRRLDPVNVEFDMSSVELPEGLEFGPAEPQPWLKHAGTMDAVNRYATAVMIIREGVADAVPCSGVLVAPRLVFTAGSCVCMLGASGEPGHGAERLLTASACAGRVSVATVSYEADPGPEPPVRMSRLSKQEGCVRAHPSLELRVDARGFVISRKADLAALFLSEPVKGALAKVLLPQAEVQEGELLIMAGYGVEEFRSSAQYVRYFRKNKTVRPPMPGDDRILYEQQGVYVYDGFTGGPCFREDSTGRWLVGIAGAGSEEELSCTSVHVYREWVREELRRSMRGGVPCP